MKQVSVVSDLCVDILVTGNVTPRYNQAEQLVADYELELGGSAAIFASQYAKLGGLVDLYGHTGDDLFGEYLLGRLEEVGVNSKISKSSESKTSLGLGLVRGSDRAMLTYDGSMRDLLPQHVFTEDFFEKTDHLHICSYFLLEQFQNEWPRIINEVKKRGGSVSLDTNWAPDGNWERMLDILPMVDVFLPNEQEAIQIANEPKIDDAGHWLGLHGPLVVVKCGGDGARVYNDANDACVAPFSVPAVLTQNLIIADTTGAGDNFDAGFLYHWLQDRPIEECLSLAFQCGTMSLREIGGISGQWTL